MTEHGWAESSDITIGLAGFAFRGQMEEALNGLLNTSVDTFRKALIGVHVLVRL